LLISNAGYAQDSASLNNPVTSGSVNAVAEQEINFLKQHFCDVAPIKPCQFKDLTATEVAPDQLQAVFAYPFYNVNIVFPNGNSTSQIVMQKDSSLMLPPDTSGTQLLPALPGIINPAFKLKTDADAAIMQNALKLIYPDQVKLFGPKWKILHDNNMWIFVTSSLLNDSGFIFKTNADGTIVSAEYSFDVQTTKTPGGK